MTGTDEQPAEGLTCSGMMLILRGVLEEFTVPSRRKGEKAKPEALMRAWELPSRGMKDALVCYLTWADYNGDAHPHTTVVQRSTNLGDRHSRRMREKLVIAGWTQPMGYARVDPATGKVSRILTHRMDAKAINQEWSPWVRIDIARIRAVIEEARLFRRQAAAERAAALSMPLFAAAERAEDNSAPGHGANTARTSLDDPPGHGHAETAEQTASEIGAPGLRTPRARTSGSPPIEDIDLKTREAGSAPGHGPAVAGPETSPSDDVDPVIEAIRNWLSNMTGSEFRAKRFIADLRHADRIVDASNEETARQLVNWVGKQRLAEMGVDQVTVDGTAFAVMATIGVKERITAAQSVAEAKAAGQPHQWRASA